MEIVQYEIVLVDLQVSEALRNPGAEMIKTRPCVVISPDELNRYLKTIVVAPTTASSRFYPTRVGIRHNQKTGWIAVDQIRTIDRRRIIKKTGKLSDPEIRKLKNVIRETYVD